MERRSATAESTTAAYYDRLSTWTAIARYLHFENKQGVLFELCEETFARLVRELETLVELEDGHELPIGLRVQAFVVAAR